MKLRRSPSLFGWAVLGMIVVVVVGAVCTWVLPRALSLPYAEGLDAAARLKAESDIRSSLVAFVAATAALFTFVIAARNFGLLRTGQLTDRFSQSVAELEADSLSRRLGAVYSLDRLASDSSFDKDSIRQVLSAFVRDSRPDIQDGEQHIRRDSEAAVRVLGGNWSRRMKSPLDLTGACIAGANLEALSYKNAILVGANFDGAILVRTNLSRAIIKNSSFLSANMKGASLKDVDKSDADLRGTCFE